MTAFLIAIVIILILGGASSINKAGDRANRYRKERGSRELERQAFDKWARIVVNDYKKIVGTKYDDQKEGFVLDVNFNKAKTAAAITSKAAKIRYIYHFGMFKEDIDENYPDIDWQEVWGDEKAIDQLIAQYKLPTHREQIIVNNYERLYPDGRYYRELYRIIEQCVIREVHEKGYRFTGPDYTEVDRDMLIADVIRSTHPHLTGDPTQQKTQSAPETKLTKTQERIIWAVLIGICLVYSFFALYALLSAYA